MAANKFEVRPGKYTIPNYGKIDTREKMTDAKQLDLYLLTSFPFIAPTKAAIPFLKRQKLPVKKVTDLVNRATTKTEVEILSELHSSNGFKAVVEEKLKHLHSL